MQNVLLLCFLGLVGMCGIASSRGTGDKSNWMIDIRDGTYLNELSLPGTRDSTFDYKSLTNQLNAGIRVFDIRCFLERHDEAFSIDGTWYKYLSDVLTELKSFLESHQSEVILVRITLHTRQRYHWEGFKKKADKILARYFQTYSSHILHYFPVKLGHVRGKIVILEANFDFDSGHAFDITIFNFFPHKARIDGIISKNIIYYNCNWECYLHNYQDLQNVFGSDFNSISDHYYDYGKNEGRNCQCIDDTNKCNWSCYLQRYSDLRDAFGFDLNSARRHFYLHGITENRNCFCDSECNWKCYLDRYSDLQNAFGSSNYAAARTHYYDWGKNEARNCLCD